ncbi:hypothetical protein [Massilia sp. CF038]|uniref:hypothetical protein n=1 Tax=Massilia sp. CF038 TaxID=1881045 RepID=UPI0009172D6C|nr:hypothetical protein [Massilia sp. CF038]SHG61359.1 hypothetical protein SAMN05428948_1286 [Massilia sp. CF038]
MVKIQAQDNSWVAMTEKPHGFMDFVVMDRQLQIADHAGINPTSWRPPSGWTLVDFSLHPSREISAILANGTAIMLVRLSSSGAPLTMQNFVDPEVTLDPYYGRPDEIRDRSAMSPLKTLDAARIAAAGSGVGIALRSGSNSVVAYRFDYANGQFTKRWRQLVEPGIYLDGVRPTSGSFDPFGGVDNHWQIHMAMDAPGRMAVAVLLSDRADLLPAHTDYFKETMPAGLIHGVLLTVFDEQGKRAQSMAIDHRDKSELHAIKWSANTVLLAGRVRTTRAPGGDGWDGYLARIDPGSRQLAVQVVDVDRGDVLFDVLPLSADTFLLAGATAYTQNPDGESVSETSAPLFLRLDTAKGTQTRIPMPSGLRGNQLRALVPYRSRWLIGGMENVPGTHSADANPALITTDAYVRELDPV